MYNMNNKSIARHLLLGYNIFYYLYFFYDHLKFKKRSLANIKKPTGLRLKSFFEAIIY